MHSGKSISYDTGTGNIVALIGNSALELHPCAYKLTTSLTSMS